MHFVNDKRYNIILLRSIIFLKLYRHKIIKYYLFYFYKIKIYYTRNYILKFISSIIKYYLFYFYKIKIYCTRNYILKFISLLIKNIISYNFITFYNFLKNYIVTLYIKSCDNINYFWLLKVLRKIIKDLQTEIKSQLFITKLYI